MFKSKLSKIIVSLLRRIAGVTRSGAKRLMRAMLQTLMAMGRRARLPVAGFVLPTVTMVLLVVILLTVAITLRSFDRANTARNVRVNQQVLAAATPALDRAKAKINFLLYEDPQRPTATPSDENLYSRLANATPGPDLYTFGDERRLILRSDLNVPANGINPDNPRNPIINPATNVENEAINTAWRYPVDTDNDGFFDSFTLYGIFSRTPARSNVAPTVGDFTRPRRPLEARTPPMSGSATPACARGGGTVASLVGNLGWYKTDDGLLKKSFFVYTVNVPITAAEAGSLGANYQAFKGTTSISALEYQQDQSRIPLANNAAVYEDDLDISPGPPLNLNGGILTNSNLLVSGVNNPNSIQLYQISSPDSCFYNQENSKITVGGNVVSGWSGSTIPTNPVGVHLFRTVANLPGPGGRTAAMQAAAQTINPANQSAIGNNSLQVLYNNAAYTARLAMLVAARRGPNPPDEDVEPVAADDPFSVRNKPDTQTRRQALEEHFKQTLRKVPFAEVGPAAPTNDPTLGFSLPWAPPLPPQTAGAWPLQGEGTDDLRPPNAWSIPTPAATNIQLTPAQLPATDPATQPDQEALLGDRVLVGNNLPALRDAANNGRLVNTPDNTGATWTGSTRPRTRSPRVTKLGDVGATDRSGFWEGEAARVPVNPLDGNGGLRVITGAGVYERINSFLPPPSWQDPVTGVPRGTALADRYDDPTTTGVTEAYPVVWPDTMPMSPLGPGSQVYNNNPASGPLDWTATWPGAPLPAPPFPPGGLTPTGLAVAAGSAIDRNTPQYAKGDLRMRATVVYHYANNPTAPGTFNETPLACISSYYDPSTASTARNRVGLPNVSGDTTTPLGTPGTQVGSNNGVVYGVNGIVAGRAIGPLAPVNGLFPGNSPLVEQANLVFPDGRFVNPLLRDALERGPAPGARSLAQTAAIDSTNCALQILAGTAGAPVVPIPDGAIKEVAFLNAREIKAIDRDDWTTTNVNEAFTLSSPLTGPTTPGPQRPAILTGNYNLPLEEREPLEIRATQIDLNVLRSTPIGAAGEYLLPNSGIIYASRDDALPDRSARIPGRGGASIDEPRSASVSPTDSRLDPTRKPNGILLVNGAQLARTPGIGNNPSVAAVVQEKGLTLASNLPVYIQGNFNLHTQLEFQGPFAWASFYDRQTLNPNFACRQNDPRVTGCGIGDAWRPANVLSDAVTLLSANYRFGFRNEGDFDLRNNAGAAAVLLRKQQGFYTNNFVTNGLSSGAFSVNGGPLGGGATLTDANYANRNALRSSYFNNFVTPVQRRGQFPEYVMEVCTRLPVSACGDGDWYVDPARATIAPLFGKANVNDNITAAATPYPAGTTAIPPAPELQRFPRRVAFQRTYTPPLPSPTVPTAFALANLPNPVPLGVNAGNQVIPVTAPGQARTTSTNSLWFATTAASGGNPVTYGLDDFPYVFNRNLMDSTGAVLPVLAAASAAPNAGSQPLLMPVLQTQTVGPAGARSAALPLGGVTVQATGWIPQALPAGTTFNLIVGSNDTPSRALGNNVGDFNGGLQNLARFLENWDNIASNIQGSFIQFNRSAYSTAPYLPILDPAAPQQRNPNTQLLSLFAPPTLAPLPIAGPAPAINYSPTPPQAGYRTAAGSIPGGNNLGRIPFFTPPNRNWGYDVGLVSQSPDLFTQRFTAPPAQSTPDEYFREVPRNDRWVETLMCAEVAPPAPGTSGPPAIPATNPNRPAVCPPPNL
ncbi:hormogonium polysaccharide biosynthesis protein HpsA [Microcoleus sp. T3B2]|uniref:hormogonium polysaccharide biosynthesis protein HpsA n=1 Tax=Microcoleus sp. T3B2 TaxID=3055426 RepID=UPI002FD3BEAF